MRKRGGRKRALGTLAPVALPQGVKQRWSLNFVSDALACGRRFRILNVIIDRSRDTWPVSLTLRSRASGSCASWRRASRQAADCRH